MELGTFAGARRKRPMEGDGYDGGGSSLRVSFEPLSASNSSRLMPKLVSYLEKISPCAAKACPILENEYVIWLNKTFNIVHIQTKVEFNRGSSMQKCGIISKPISSSSTAGVG